MLTVAELQQTARAEMTTATDITWQEGDGYLKAEDFDRKIVFKHGFVRVRSEDYTAKGESRADDTPKTLNVPAHHRCEVLGGAKYYYVNN